MPTTRLSRFNQLPLELSSRNLLPLRKGSEPVIILLLHGIGNLTTYRMQGRTNRVFRFEWDRRLQCHVVRIPHSVWSADNMALAKEALDHKLMLPVLVNAEFELPYTNASSTVSEQTVTVSADLQTEEGKPEGQTETEADKVAVNAELLKPHLPARITALSSKLHISADDIRSVVLKADSGLVFKPGGWVCLAGDPASEA